MSEISFDQKRIFRRLIVRTNSGSLTPERTESLRRKIHDPAYLSFTIDRLADNLSKVFTESYSTVSKD